MNPQVWIARVRKAVRGRNCLARVLYQCSVLRMQERSLSFAEKSEAGFVDRSSANGPAVCDVHLLGAIIGQVAKARKIPSARLKSRKRLFQVVLREIVIAR